MIKVKDFTNSGIYMKELLLVKVKICSEDDKSELFRIAQVFHSTVVDYGLNEGMLESVGTEGQNNELIRLLRSRFKNIEVARGGSVGIESI